LSLVFRRLESTESAMTVSAVRLRTEVMRSHGAQFSNFPSQTQAWDFPEKYSTNSSWFSKVFKNYRGKLTKKLRYGNLVLGKTLEISYEKLEKNMEKS